MVNRSDKSEVARIMPTDFLPAERATSSSVEKDFTDISNSTLFNKTLNMMPDAVLILNPERQIVFCNNAFLRLLSLSDIKQVLGLRPGEAVKCRHSDETDGGCGTTIFCRECGVPKAMLKAQQLGQADEECRISLKNGDALDIRVWTVKFELANRLFTSFAVSDVSSQNRRRVLERIFFHDILNIASGMRGLTEMFGEVSSEQKSEIQCMIHGLSYRLIDEISAQRELAAAESGEITPRFELSNPRQIISEITDTFTRHDAAKGKTLKTEGIISPMTFKTDKTLLHRVIVNMTKNALEACSAGETVTIGCDLTKGSVQFWVHNPSVMPDEVQHQMFQRSFSTKGAGRGLGTYSMRLLTERYLKGKVTFESSQGQGTRFTVSLPLA